MSDVIPLGHSNSISKFPRQGCVIVTVTATCSSVFIPDCLRSSAETESERREGETEREKTSQPLSDRQTFWLPHLTDKNVNISEKVDTECEICEWFSKFTRPYKSVSHEGMKEHRRGSELGRLFKKYN